MAAVVAAHSTYRERLAYIAGYATVRQQVEGVDNALGIDISPMDWTAPSSRSQRIPG